MQVSPQALPFVHILQHCWYTGAPKVKARVGAGKVSRTTSFGPARAADEPRAAVAINTSIDFMIAPLLLPAQRQTQQIPCHRWKSLRDPPLIVGSTTSRRLRC
jgi:hypothetical protein